MTPAEPVFFASRAAFRAWLEKNHENASELWVGLYKKHAGHRGLTYPEAVLEALCFGWIDGVLRRIDADRHMQRFTPRRPGSVWSNLNVSHVERLTREGRMTPAGLEVFRARSVQRTGIYSFEQKAPAKLPAAYEKLFKAHATAWEYFNAQPRGYRHLVIFRIVSAKQEATRQRRLQQAIDASAAQRRLE